MSFFTLILVYRGVLGLLSSTSLNMVVDVLTSTFWVVSAVKRELFTSFASRIEVISLTLIVEISFSSFEISGRAKAVNVIAATGST